VASWHECELPPAMLAAARARARGDAINARQRAYPFAAGSEDDAGAALLAATRALLVVRTPEELAAVVATLVHDLGGGVVPARLAEHTALPLDISFGLTEPLLAWAEPVSVAALQLADLLPKFVADAREVFDRLAANERRLSEAEVDTLTGLLTRRAWMRRLSSAGAGDAVCLLDLDHFKAVNDTRGHRDGDDVLAAIGALLTDSFRGNDACGRYGGDELAVLAPGMSASALAARIDVVRTRWERTRPAAGTAVGLSAGVAAVRQRGGGRAALEAADRALYRAKREGRNVTRAATADDESGDETTR
jgi:diguanylate cyclase (GGDEF)-like protein